MPRHYHVFLVDDIDTMHDGADNVEYWIETATNTTSIPVEVRSVALQNVSAVMNSANSGDAIPAGLAYAFSS